MGRKILLVEDEPANRLLVKVVFQQEGFTVIENEDGRGVVEQTKATRPDLILLDILLPETNGLEIFSALRADPETRHVPVIAVTAMTQKRDLERAEAVGLTHYVTKPFEPEELLAKVRTVLGD